MESADFADRTELWSWFFHMGRHPWKQQFDLVISSNFTVYILNFGPEFLSVNQNVWIFNIVQNGLIFRLQFLYNSLPLWLKSTEKVLVTDRFPDSLWVSLEVKLVAVAATFHKKIGALISSVKFLPPVVVLYLYKWTILPFMELYSHM